MGVVGVLMLFEKRVLNNCLILKMKKEKKNFDSIDHILTVSFIQTKTNQKKLPKQSHHSLNENYE